MTVPFSTGKQISINQLTGVDITDVANNNVLQYNSTNAVWDNGGLDLSGQDINVDEIDCRVLRVSETADIVGRLANQGVASFVNDGFIFQNGVSNLGDTLYIDNVNKALALTGTNYGTAGSVLTSNGAGNATTWNSPYHIRAFCNIDTNTVPENTNITITNMVIDSSTTSSNATGNFASNAWTPPGGIYQINLQLSISRIPSANIYAIRFELMKNGSSIRLSRLDNENNSSGQDIMFSTLSMCDIIDANGTDVFDFRTIVQISGTGGTYSIRANTTSFSAYKIG